MRPLMAPQVTDQKWYSIAEQASRETDPAKLATLVAQLCSALDERITLAATGRLAEPTDARLSVN
jgi:hypothetical protein